MSAPSGGRELSDAERGGGETLGVGSWSDVVDSVRLKVRRDKRFGPDVAEEPLAPRPRI